MGYMETLDCDPLGTLGCSAGSAVGAGIFSGAFGISCQAAEPAGRAKGKGAGYGGAGA